LRKKDEFYGTDKQNSLLSQINDRLEGFNPFYKPKIDFPHITFGIEIEFKVDESKVNDLLESLLKNKLCYEQQVLERDQAKSVDGWKLSKETNGAYEIISPVLQDLEVHWSQISFICKRLNDIGAITDEDCAFHVHVGSKAFSQGRHWINLRNIYRNMEPLTYLLSAGTNESIPKKRIEHYAVPLIIADKSLYRRVYSINEVLTKIENDEDKDYVLTNLYAGRFVGLNLSNLSKKSKTIEFRTFNSTFDPALIQTYIVYVASIINKAVDENFELDKNFNAINYEISKSTGSKVRLNPLYILNCLDAIIMDSIIKNSLLWYMKQNNFEIPLYVYDVIQGKLSDEKRKQLL